MSEFHDFYKELSSVCSQILWTVQCSSDPVPLSELYSEEISEDQTYRELMYCVNSNILTPHKIEEELHFSYNNLVEWAYGVYPLVRDNSLEELKELQREIEADKRVHEDVHDAEDVEEYISSNEDINEREVVEWIVSDQKAEWIEDAITHYELLNSFVDNRDTTIDPDLVEKEFVHKKSSQDD